MTQPVQRDATAARLIAALQGLLVIHESDGHFACAACHEARDAIIHGSDGLEERLQHDARQRSFEELQDVADEVRRDVAW